MSEFKRLILASRVMIEQELALAAMGVMRQNSITKKSSLKEGVSKSDILLNWVIWLISILISALPLIVVPFVKSLVQDRYTEFFNDVFGNSGIIIISVSLAVATVLELIAGNRKPKLVLLLGSFLFFLIALGILAYGIVAGISEYAALKELVRPQPIERLARINIVFFAMMFILSSVLFVFRERRFLWD